MALFIAVGLDGDLPLSGLANGAGELVPGASGTLQVLLGILFEIVAVLM